MIKLPSLIAGHVNNTLSLNAFNSIRPVGQAYIIVASRSLEIQAPLNKLECHLKTYFLGIDEYKRISNKFHAMLVV